MSPLIQILAVLLLAIAVFRQLTEVYPDDPASRATKLSRALLRTQSLLNCPQYGPMLNIHTMKAYKQISTTW